MNTDTYHATLSDALTTITAELEQIAHFDTVTGDWIATPETDTIGTADENVAADTTEEWNERRALMTQLETRYRNIKRALKKIDTGTYGVCEISGDPIEPERLTANPAARTNLANIDRESELPL